MIKSFITRTCPDHKSCVEELTNKLNQLDNNECEIVSTSINKNNNTWAGTIFYKISKYNKFSLR